MAKNNSEQIKPDRTTPIEVEVLASTKISPHFQRVTVGGGEIDRFESRGRDQWFRLFVPTPEGGMRLPRRDGLSGYAQLLATPKAVRPTMRNYTVRAYRAATAERGAELDIDFVLHADAATGELAGVAASWADAVEPGARLGLLDEGYGFEPAPDASWFLIVGDETALPAVAGVLAALPRDARGVAIVELPDAADAQELDAPAGVVVQWIARPHGVRHGALAYRAALEVALPAPAADGGPVVHGYAAGEQALATGVRRHLVTANGWDRHAVSFCGYWRLPKEAPAIDSAEALAAATTEAAR